MGVYTAAEALGGRHVRLAALAWWAPAAVLTGRQNALVLQGWVVLRFTWWMLEDQPETFVREVRQAIRSIRSVS